MLANQTSDSLAASLTAPFERSVKPAVSPAERTLPQVQLAGKCDCYVLSNGVELPCLGFGTYMVPNDDTGAAAIRGALDLGFRHIDTATSYKNEDLVGRVIRESGIPRSEIFITSKLNNPDQGYDETMTAFQRSIDWLGTDYLDLYLIHWPKVAATVDHWEHQVRETWRAFEDLYRAGRIRAIGVSNFLVHHMETLLETATVAPMVDQLELNPTYQQREIVAWCQEHGVQLEAWGPLGRGHIFKHEGVAALAARLGKDVGQVCVRYALQKGFVTMPKSTKPARIKSNSEVFDFELSAEDMALLDSLQDDNSYYVHPDRLDEWGERVARAHAESGVA